MQSVPIPDYIGPYRIIQLHAKGGFAEIFQTENQGNRYALKKLHSYLKYDSEFQLLLENEARLLQMVDPDPHFPKWVEAGNFQDQAFIIMEWIDGVNLEVFTEKTNPKHRQLPDLFSAYLIGEIAEGLRRIHALNFFPERPTVHGDIRPSNIMLEKSGGIKLIDLGLKGGTFDFMPLERLHDKTLTYYTDIYATGHILYELTHCEPLFKAKTQFEAYQQMRELEVAETIFRPELHPALKSILTKCLNQNEGKHYLEAGALIEDTQDYLRKENFNRVDFREWLQKVKIISQ